MGVLRVQRKVKRAGARMLIRLHDFRRPDFHRANEA